MYTIRQISISMFAFLIVLSFLLLNASLISMDDGQDSGNQQDLVAGSQYEIVQNYPFAQPGSIDDYDPYVFISSVAERLKSMDKYIEKSLSVLTEDEHDDSIKARMKTIMSVTRLARLDIGRIQSDIENFFELIKSVEDSEEKCKFVDLPGAWYGSNLTGKQQSGVAENQAAKSSVPAQLLSETGQTNQKEIAAAMQQEETKGQDQQIKSAPIKPAPATSGVQSVRPNYIVLKGGAWHNTRTCSCESCTRGRGGSARGNCAGHRHCNCRHRR
ncbi:hypothetical protein E3J79_04435 [Candidatus Dependentiae bacterium]|nr:MAG: hypothetical protein E3J79_04435 [Candidatus Dependentiae bacterium]